jgi:hypothetical protein
MEDQYIIIDEFKNNLYYRTIDIKGNLINVKLASIPRNKKKKRNSTPYHGKKI